MSDLICFAVPGTDEITYYIEEPDIAPEGLSRMNTDIPEKEIPVKSRYIALSDGTWEKTPDNSIFLLMVRFSSNAFKKHNNSKSKNN